MSTTQVGQFTVGSVGLQIDIAIANPDNAFDFASVAGPVLLDITRPDGTVINRTLSAPDGVIGNAPLIRYTVQAGDLTLLGAYSFRLTINFTPTLKLVETGSFIVSDDPASDLIKEDGTGLEDANSYADVADGDQYHAGHLYAAPWTAATFARKETALIMAARFIDAHWSFKGARSTDTQAMAFPRAYIANSERAQMGVYDPANILQGLAGYGSTYYVPVYPADEVPVRIIAANCELARLLLVRDRTAEDPAKGIQSMGIGSGALSFTFSPGDRIALFTTDVTALLTPFGTLASAMQGSKPLVRT